jgi:stage II sporulation protein D
MRRRVVVAVVAAGCLCYPGAASAGSLFLIKGAGWGSGVGMSQWGAEGYARHGYDYQRILAHYYPQTVLTAVQPRPVRVLLARGLQKVRVGSAAPYVVIDPTGRKVHLPAGHIMVGRALKVHHLKLRSPLRFMPGAQPLQLEYAAYRGDLVVRRKRAGLQIVNILPLDRYLRGVVPGEVPRGWHEATYRAQAVASRSYTLATLKPGKEFDLFPDTRSQVYEGIAGERPQTNLAIGATAGQVLTWNGTIITAYYFSTSGGRTSSIHDAWPRSTQVPYLVSVPDPYDYISPHHVWPTMVLSPAAIGRALKVDDVRDAVVVENSSGRAARVRVLGAMGWRTFPAGAVREKFKLGSNDFELSAMSLDDPDAATFGSIAQVHGWVRGLGKARLQELTAAGWATVAHIHTTLAGRFAVSLKATRSAQFRLAYNGIAGDSVALVVAPRVSLTSENGMLRVAVAPRLPFQVQRLSRQAWRAVATVNGSFRRTVVPGSYRVRVLGGAEYASTTSAPIGVRRAG